MFSIFPQEEKQTSVTFQIFNVCQTVIDIQDGYDKSKKLPVSRCYWVPVFTFDIHHDSIPVCVLKKLLGTKHLLLGILSYQGCKPGAEEDADQRSRS